jgi:hypothetical protein
MAGSSQLVLAALAADRLGNLDLAHYEHGAAPARPAQAIENKRLTNRAGEWQPIAEPAWTERPDWDAIDQHAQHLRQGW